MRVCTGLTRVEFALLLWSRTTSRTPDALYPFESRSLGLHNAENKAIRKGNMFKFAQCICIGA